MSVEHILLILSILFLVSLAATKAGSRFGVPVLLLFLAIGMLFGSDGIGFEFHNYNAAQVIGTVALCIILFSGGLDTKYRDIRPVAAQGVLLATLGVLLTAVFTGTFIYYVTHWIVPWIHLTFLESLLLGSIMSSTDSASVFSILRSNGVRLKNNLRPMLEFESGSNDPMAYMLTVTLIPLIQTGGVPEYGTAMLHFGIQFIVGGAAGYLLGQLAVFAINRINLQNDSLYPILLFTSCIFIFSVTYFLNGNGYLAVYLGGVVIGNARIVQRRSSMRFFDGLAWISQMIMFLTLGLLVNPSELGAVALISVVIGVFMIVASRPLAVFISLLPFRRMHTRDQFFVSWVGLRGAVPIIFAILPFVAGLEHSDVMFNIVFFITLISLIVQGTTLTPFAKWLHLGSVPKANRKFEHFGDIEMSEDIKSTMTEITVSESMLSHGNNLLKLPLPENTLVVMVKRAGRYFIPKGQTELLLGDVLLVITNDESTLFEAYRTLGIEDYKLKRNR
jgi:cell volume regulation protein A